MWCNEWSLVGAAKAYNHWSKCGPKWQFGGLKSAVIEASCLFRKKGKKQKHFNGNGN